MRLYSWNINGLRAALNKGTFQSFIAKENPDILGLQETRAKEGQAEIDLPQYFEFYNGAERGGYSGTAIFSKIKPLQVTNDLPTEYIEEFGSFKDNYGNPLNEGRLVTAEYNDFYYLTVYTPNSKEDLSRLNLRHKIWDPAFLKYCKDLEQSKPVIISGDLNVAHTENDLANPKANRGKHGFTDAERQGFQNFIETDFIDTFRLFKQGNGYYTWWTHWANARARNIGWRIDYFLVSNSLKDRVKNSKIHPDIMGSDHCPISIELK